MHKQNKEILSNMSLFSQKIRCMSTDGNLPISMIRKDFINRFISLVDILTIAKICGLVGFLPQQNRNKNRLVNYIPHSLQVHPFEFKRQLIVCKITATFFIFIPFVGFALINQNSDKTFFISFNNCYILSPKSLQTLENAKFIASEFALKLSLVLYPFPKPFSEMDFVTNSHKGKNKGKKKL